ncbi:lysylphosphatidylglycerol synthase transmembrane domain-containing protein [Deinococcus peraridilitoris]|uniref:Integral membrane protein n=1 Tax=Deinococcus peraridilitoris (strain DSM 19664 / LMG 22246 / CIP 109416 / KR-200) TaxID=937777 RepID=L0A5J6_DEIPD|nr:flippase-like domain-containing protein [Deinococcus peraridilitoris]AFZ68709.1 hypothetical protein Deipe_3267 [Deinococcus peraridilitoris DSM 19664]
MKRSWTLLLNGAVLAGLALAVHRYVNGEDLLALLRTTRPAEAVVVMLLGLVYTLIKGARFVGMAVAVGAPNGAMVMHAYLAAESATVLPGGVAFRAALLAQAGLPVARGSVPVVLSSVVDQGVFALCTLLAALLDPRAHEAVLTAGLVLGLFALVWMFPAARHRLARWLLWLFGQLRIAETFTVFLAGAHAALRAGPLLSAVGLTLVSLVVKVLTLQAALAALGTAAPWLVVFVAVIVPTMLGRLTPVPGGVGVTEAGMVGLLVSGSEVGTEAALAASLLYRVSTVFLPVLLGGLIYFLTWQRAVKMSGQQARG